MKIATTNKSKSLNTALGQVLAAVAVQPGEAVFGWQSAEQWGKSVTQALLVAGILHPYSGRASTVCPGCEESCVMPIDERSGTSFVSCDKPQAYGRIDLEALHLEQWGCSLERLATRLSILLQGMVEPTLMQNGLMALGNLQFGKAAADVFLAAPEADLSVVRTIPKPVVLGVGAGSGPAGILYLDLAEVLYFKDDVLVFDVPRAETLINPPRKAQGRPKGSSQHNWTAYKQEFGKLIDEHGMPTPEDPELKNQAAVEKRLAEWGEEQFGIAPSEAVMRTKVSAWLAERKKAQKISA